MKTRNYFMILINSVLLFSCLERIGPALNPEVNLIYKIYDKDNTHKIDEILGDTISTSELKGSIWIDICDINIIDKNQVELIIDSSPNWPNQFSPRTISITTQYDKENFTDKINVFTPQGGIGTNIINDIYHHNIVLTMQIPIKIGSEVVIGNDTIELSTSEFDFFNTSYKSPLSQIELTKKLFVK